MGVFFYLIYLYLRGEARRGIASLYINKAKVIKIGDTMFMKTVYCIIANDHANERYKSRAQLGMNFMPVFCPDPEQDAIERCPSR